jgi:pimeloyl-ACP methyl ester carboxylesterase
MDTLAPKFHVLAADSYGAGKSPVFPSDRRIGLRDEVALLEPVFARAGRRFSLVGHSYGGAVALIAALVHRPKVRALALYEPTLFALVERAQDVDGIRNTVSSAVEALRRGDALGAARFFIEFWIAPGAFDRMPERNQVAIAEAGRNIQHWKDALFGEPTPLAAFAKLDVPVLLVTGARSPLSSRAVVERLRRVLPNAEVAELAGLGHMAPVTDPEAVNPVICRFLERVAHD